MGGVTSGIIVVVLLFNLGFALPSESLKQGLANVKLHVLIQTFIFVLVPAYFFLTTLPFRSSFEGAFLIGVLALACVPTTAAVGR